MTEKLIVNFKKKSVFLFVLLQLSVLAIMLFSLSRMTAFGMTLDVFGMVGLVVYFYISMERLSGGKAALEVGEEGIWDFSSLKGAGFIKWDEIDELRLYTYWGYKVMGIVPKNAEQFLASVGFVKRNLLKMNVQMGFPPVNIAELALEISLEDLLRFIEENGLFKGRIVRWMQSKS
jgi:hypothetical protein